MEHFVRRTLGWSRTGPVWWGTSYGTGLNPRPVQAIHRLQTYRRLEGLPEESFGTVAVMRLEVLVGEADAEPLGNAGQHDDRNLPERGVRGRCAVVHR